MGLTWAVAWSGVGVVWALLRGGGDLVMILSLGTGFASLGFIGGTAFAVVLGIADGRRRLDEMSPPRFASWGALGGLLLSVFMFVGGMPLTPSGIITVGVLTLLGAGSAAGSLALARKSEDQELLEAGEEALCLTEGG